METINKHLESLDNRLNSIKAEAEKKISERKFLVKRYEECLNKVKEYLPRLNAVLEKNGYSIEKIQYHKSGSDSDIWKDGELGDSLNISFTLIPSEKVKLVPFMGYTKSGVGKNQEILKRRAKRLHDLIVKNTDFKSVGVNHYSFEIRRNEKTTNSIFVDAWIS